jgi:hypothetical protein
MKGSAMQNTTFVIRLLSRNAALILALSTTALPASAQAPECGRTYPAQMFGGQAARYGWEIGAGADCVNQGNRQTACRHFRAAELALGRVETSTVMTERDLAQARPYLDGLFRDNKCEK